MQSCDSLYKIIFSSLNRSKVTQRSVANSIINIHVHVQMKEDTDFQFKKSSVELSLYQNKNDVNQASRCWKTKYMYLNKELTIGF